MMTARKIMLLAGLCAGLAGCSGREETDPAAPDAVPSVAPADAATEGAASASMFDAANADRIDKFTYANYDEVRVSRLALDLAVRFDEKVLEGEALLALEYVDPDARRLVLDTDDLEILSVLITTDEPPSAAPAPDAPTPDADDGARWLATPFMLGPDDPILGAQLVIDLPEQATAVRIAYRTSPGAAGLQWLAPAQTAGGEAPFVYSQAQAIHARSFVPLQDTPAVRFPYAARLTAPEGLLAVMSAGQDPDGETDGEFFFDMPQPAPSYLLAFAVGDIAFKAISDHMGVYAEDYILDAAAAEFEDTPRMEEAAAALYGPYRWGRYDMLVLPPSFPYGGMENPRLSFLTPTLVAGDKSLTSVVAHELAHSWSGNLVTNATWRDAWLNEGFTTYVENRLMEALYGPARAEMERALEYDALGVAVKEALRPAMTRLKLPADISSPDDAFTDIAYIKGAFFLRFLEERYGRETFDPFLKAYFETFAFKSIVTEDFLAYLNDELRARAPSAVSEAELREWVYGEGLPETIQKPQSDRFDAVSVQRAEWFDGARAAKSIETDDWSAHEWLHFINSLPNDIPEGRLAELDAVFQLSESANAEIAFAWYMKAIAADYKAAERPLEAFLIRVGRGKFIYRLYDALAKAEKRDWALDIYERARRGYHPIAQRRVDAILGATP